MKKTFEGWLFNKIEIIGNKKYNHVGCEGGDKDFGNFLSQFVPQIGMRRKVKFTIDTQEKPKIINKKKEFEKLLKEYRSYAKKNGFRLNPDQKVVDSLIGALLEREKKYGKRYCPCRLIKKVEKEDNKIICPCIYHKKEIKKQGHCHCFLFVK